MNQITNGFWTGEKIQSLTKLWGDGLSAAKIQEVLGAPSRNSVLGKANRLGLSKPSFRFWTKEKIADLVRLWNEGYSASVIKEFVGAASKNAILNKAERLKLPARSPKNTQRTVHYRRAYIPRSVAELPLPNEQFKCTLMELVNDTCRWPLWNESHEPKFYCGTPEADCANGKPYCRWHTARSQRQSEISLEALA